MGLRAIGSERVSEGVGEWASMDAGRVGPRARKERWKEGRGTIGRMWTEDMEVGHARKGARKKGGGE